VYTYDASWRLLQEDVDDDFTNNPGFNTRVQHAWGLRYIDDAVEQRRGTYAGSSAAPGDAVSYDKEYFHLTDVQCSTTALVDSAGTLKERVQYAAYGQAAHRWPGDFDASDTVTAGGDQAAMTTKLSASSTDRTLGGSAYDADYDLNRDGVVDSTDASILSTTWLGKSTVGTGQISDGSSGGPQNTIGYCGYVFSSELTQYHVRHRWYEPALGRWTTRDPAGYVDGMSLYESVSGRGLNGIDPSGLSWLSDLVDGVISILGGEGSKKLAKGADNGITNRQRITKDFLDDPTVGGALVEYSAGERKRQDRFGEAGKLAETAVVDTATGGIVGGTKHLFEAGIGLLGLVVRGEEIATDAIVIGKGASYVKMGESTGARIFRFEAEVWNAMSEQEKIAAETAFLDEALSRGSEIILSTSAKNASGWFKWELDYLKGKGYIISGDGTKMIKPACK
jgi:RHS repeat-associated protein